MDPAHSGFQGLEPGDFGTPGPSLGQKGPPLSPAPPLSFLRTLFTCGCRCYCCSAVAVESVPACGVLEREQSQLSSVMPKARSDSEAGGNPGRFH